MSLTKIDYKNALKQAIYENDLDVIFEPNDTYYLIRNNESIISTQLLISSKINIARHGSHNGNETHGIGVFKFDLPIQDIKPDYFVMAFENTKKGSAEFVIIGYDDLVQRLMKRNRLKENNAEVWLWLMPENKVYDCTNISIEDEWHFISNGAGSRMADGTDMDYSGYLNNWNELNQQL